MFEYEEQRGKVECEECPSCGRPRPIDWFVREGGPCWRCRALGKVPAGPQGEARGRGLRQAFEGTWVEEYASEIEDW